jgi:hypothetical protein
MSVILLEKLGRQTLIPALLYCDLIDERAALPIEIHSDAWSAGPDVKRKESALVFFLIGMQLSTRDPSTYNTLKPCEQVEQRINCDSQFRRQTDLPESRMELVGHSHPAPTDPSRRQNGGQEAPPGLTCH